MAKAQEFVNKYLTEGKILSDKKDAKNTAAFYSEPQIAALSKLLIERFQEAGQNDGKADKAFKARLVEAVKNAPSTSELLFGRMFASNPDLNYDAACQVAHAFSVNEVYDEPDYFTVVGDYRKEENLAGSDYIDSRLFNSGILYRFADVNLSEGSELRNEHYQVDAAKTAIQFLESFVMSMPTGSANSYANMTLPEFVVVELREDAPISFAPVFAKAIEDKDICGKAMEEMTKYQTKVNRLYGEPLCKWVLGDEGVALRQLCEQVEDQINRRL